MFIELTDSTGARILVNSDQVLWVRNETEDVHTVIHFCGGQFEPVEQNIDEIRARAVGEPL